MGCSGSVVDGQATFEEVKQLGDPFLELVVTKTIESIEESVNNIEELAKGSEGGKTRDRGHEMDAIYAAVTKAVVTGFQVAGSVQAVQHLIRGRL